MASVAAAACSVIGAPSSTLAGSVRSLAGAGEGLEDRDHLVQPLDQRVHDGRVEVFAAIGSQRLDRRRRRCRPPGTAGGSSARRTRRRRRATRPLTGMLLAREAAGVAGAVPALMVRPGDLAPRCPATPRPSPRATRSQPRRVSCISRRSSVVSGPGFETTESGTPAIPDVMQSARHAQHIHVQIQRLGQERAVRADALKMGTGGHAPESLEPSTYSSSATRGRGRSRKGQAFQPDHWSASGRV